MRRVIVSEFMSLDGVIEDPRWSLKYWGDRISDFKQQELFDVDALLLGRVTYEGFAQAWPGRKDEDGYADRINSMQKYLVSTTAEQGEWGPTQIIRDNVAEQIRRLKEQDGQDILIFGSGKLVNSLIPAGVIDEYRLLVYPVVLGSGQRLFEDGTATDFELVESWESGTGAIALIYRRAEARRER